MIQILSIQSAVAYGFAGNSAAVFPLRRAGIDVWPVLTVNYSNHTGYGSWRGINIPAEQVREVVLGIDDRGVFADLDAVLSGYQGTPDMAQVIVDSVKLVKERSPRAIYCCDPVMGDVGRDFYAMPGIPEFMRDVVTPVADVMTPNLFELEFLTGTSTHTIAEVIDAAQKLRAMGPETVLVTSVVGQDDESDVMRMIALDSTAIWQVETPYLNRIFTGSGDVTTAMFLAHLLGSGDLEEALSATASIVFSILDKTLELGRSELALVQAQDDIVNPSHTFKAIQIG